MRIARSWILAAALALVMSAVGCGDDSTTTPGDAPIELTTYFNLNVDGLPIILNQLIYTNDAGTTYSIKSLRFVITDVVLHNVDGGSFKIADLHYFDLFNASSQVFQYTGLPHEEWNGVSFTFGLDETDNVRDKYLSRTEFHQDMQLQRILGENLGYHYMQLEGTYVSTPDTLAYTTHMAPRQLDGTNLDFPGVVDATPYHFHFAVDLPFTPTHIHNEGQGELTINFNLNDWYKDNNAADGTENTLYDFADYPIVMGNLDAQGKLSANGRHCFSAALESHGGHH